MKHLILLILLTPSVFLQAQRSIAPNVQPPQMPGLDSVRLKMQQLVQDQTVASLSVGVLYKGQTIWLESFGWADKEGRVAARPDMIYPLGSLSKSMTATGLMHLVAKGKVSLSDPVGPILAPWELRTYRGEPGDVTVGHVLNMSAGIPHGWTTYRDSGRNPQIPAEKQAFFERYAISTSTPGKYHHYSNYSYGVAANLIEKIAGRSLEQYMEEVIFAKLEMQDSYVHYEASRTEDFVRIYDSNGAEMAPYRFLPTGGAGYYSSVPDLLQYGQFFLKTGSEKTRSLLPDETIDLMHHYPPSPNSLFGLGWFNTGHSLVSNGSISGAASNLTLIPADDLAVVCLTNTSSRGYSIPDQLVDEIIDVLLPDLEKKMDMETFIAIYETPYQVQNALLGNWRGSIQVRDSPKQNLELSFLGDGTIRARVDNAQPTAVNNATFNRFNRFTGGFNAKVLVPEFTGDQGVYCQLILRLEDGVLTGHIAPMFSNAEGNFSYGAFVQLERQKE